MRMPSTGTPKDLTPSRDVRLRPLLSAFTSQTSKKS
jgi:hypothetical protein